MGRLTQTKRESVLAFSNGPEKTPIRMIFTKDSGKTINLMGSEGTFGTLVIIMRVNIRMGNVMATENTYTQAAVAIQANGRTISFTERGLIRSPMVRL